MGTSDRVPGCAALAEHREGGALACLSLSYRERAALAKVSERPVPFGEIAPRHVHRLIEHGLVKSALGHYLITAKGQLERQRQSFRAASAGKRAHVDGRRFLFLQESRFQGETVPRSRIWEWLSARGRRVVAGRVSADQRTQAETGVIGRLRAFVTDRASDEVAGETDAAPRKAPGMAQLVPASFREAADAATGDDAEADLFMPRTAQRR